MERFKNRQLWADLLMLLVTAVWGGTFVMVKDAVSAYPVFPFLALRFGLATVVLLPIGFRRLRTLGWRDIGAGILVGLCLTAGYGFQTLGLQSTTASKAGFITGLSVVIVPLLSTLFLRRLPAIEAIAGVILATIGLALLTLDQRLEIAVGDLLILGCAVSFALHIVGVSAFVSRMDALAFTIVQVATVTVSCAALALATGSPWPAPSGSTWLAAGFTGLFATAAAFLIQTAAQRFTTPTHTALIFAGEPVFAAIFGVLLGGDLVTPRLIAGGILIVVGTVISEIRWSHRTATVLSRFLSPHYVSVPMLVVVGWHAAASPTAGLAWALGMGIVAVSIPVLLFTFELRRGRISDWHVSDRRERLKPRALIASVSGPALPLVLLLSLRGPHLLRVTFLSALLLVTFNVLVTFIWKISQHTATIAATATLMVALLGLGALPILLLIPLIAWARVKVGAHTVMQVVAGGFVGVSITFLTLHAFGYA